MSGARTARSVTWLGIGAALLAVAGVACLAATRRHRPSSGPVRDYSGRSGFPGPAGAMRGRAREAFFADGAAHAPAHLPDASS